MYPMEVAPYFFYLYACGQILVLPVIMFTILCKGRVFLV
jgi:hypothetical protein